MMAKRPDTVDWVALIDSVWTNDAVEPTDARQNDQNSLEINLAGSLSPPPAVTASGQEDATELDSGRPQELKKQRSLSVYSRQSIECCESPGSTYSSQTNCQELFYSEDPLAVTKGALERSETTPLPQQLPSRDTPGQSPESILTTTELTSELLSLPNELKTSSSPLLKDHTPCIDSNCPKDAILRVCKSQPTTPQLLRTPTLKLVPVTIKRSLNSGSCKSKQMDILSYLDTPACTPKALDKSLKSEPKNGEVVSDSKSTTDVLQSDDCAVAMGTSTPFNPITMTTDNSKPRRLVLDEVDAYIKSTSFAMKTGQKRRRGSNDRGGAKASAKKQRVANGIRSHLEQWHLDLGQKDFGHVTCPQCGMIYTYGQPEDSQAHLKFHRHFLSGIRFPGWKNERIVGEFSDGRVILVLPSDPKNHLKKVEAICMLIDSDLGYATGVGVRRNNYKVYLYISTTKRLMGCVVAEAITQGYAVLSPEDLNDHKHATTTRPVSTTPLEDSDSTTTVTADQPSKVVSKCYSSPTFDHLSAWFCSHTPQPAHVGISRMWVADYCRRRGVATKLLNVVRLSFTPGSIVPLSRLAFTDPTPDGKAFAARYCQTENFLVYR